MWAVCADTTPLSNHIDLGFGSSLLYRGFKPMAVKVTSRFASPMDTAKALGVPRRRALELIKLANSILAESASNGFTRLNEKATSAKPRVAKRQKRAKRPKAAR